jgi:hypothetical protein
MTNLFIITQYTEFLLYEAVYIQSKFWTSLSQSILTNIEDSKPVSQTESSCARMCDQRQHFNSHLIFPRIFGYGNILDKILFWTFFNWPSFLRIGKSFEWNGLESHIEALQYLLTIVVWSTKLIMPKQQIFTFIQFLKN